MASFRKALILSLALAGVAAASACAPTVARQGFQVQDTAPKDVKVGEDTKSTVLEKLGSPSVVSTFEPNVWFYISQTTEKYTYHNAKVSQRDVTVVTFDKASEKVSKVDNLGLKDGKHLTYAARETPTRGRELSVLEQLLGTVGQKVLPQTDDNTGPNGPNGRRGD